MINIFLLVPIVYVIFLYFRNFKYKTKILYAEAYLGLNVLCYCVYYLIAYRIHHSYADLTKNDFLIGIYIFYILFITSSIYVYLSEKKISIFDKLILRTNTKYFKILSPKTNNKLLILFFFIIGFIIFYINRSAILVCNHDIFGEIKQVNFIHSLFQKFHTIGYFGFFLIFSGILLFINRVLIINDYKKYLGIFLYFIILSIFVLLTLSTSSSVSILIAYFITSSLVLHTISKKFFYLNFIVLTLLIVILNSVKNEIRKEFSPMIRDCKLNMIDNSYTIAAKSSNFYIFNKEKKYMLKNGEFVTTDVSFIEYIAANFFERVDFLQMLSQTRFLSNLDSNSYNNDKLEFKYGDTYLNSSILWQKQFGVDIKQANMDDNSSFNMPASVESFYNFGVIGFVFFSVIMGGIIFLTSKILNSEKLSKEAKILLTVSFFPFLNLENHFIFMLKNWIYVSILIISVIILTNIFANLLNKRT